MSSSDAQDHQPVVVTRTGAVTTISIQQPALNTSAKQLLRDVTLEAAHDRTVRAVILTGSGRTFCVGQDLAEHAVALQTDPGSAFDTVDEHYAPIVRALATMPKPVIAAVNGTCVGAGLGFALACDLRVFSTSAKLGTAFNAIGLTCDSGLAVTLVRAVGASRATQLMLLGDVFTPDAAVDWGISGELVAPAQVSTAAHDLATRLAAGPTAAYAETKTLLALAASGGALETVLTAESAAQHRLGLTPDHQNAVAAFLAKEKPTFTGG